MPPQTIRGDLAAHQGNIVRGEVNQNADFDLEAWIQERLQLKPGEAVLDVACGNGKQLKRFSPLVGKSGKCVGLDIFSRIPKLMESARANLSGLGNIELIDHDANQPVHFPDSHFDAVTCSYAIYYFNDMKQALSEFYRLLKSKGRAFVVGPSWDNSMEFYSLHEKVSKRPIPNRVFETVSRINNEVIPAFYELFDDVKVSPFVNRVYFNGSDGLDRMRRYYESNMLLSDLEIDKEERNRCVGELLREVKAEIDESSSYCIIKRAIGLLGTKE